MKRKKIKKKEKQLKKRNFRKKQTNKRENTLERKKIAIVKEMWIEKLTRKIMQRKIGQN